MIGHQICFYMEKYGYYSFKLSLLPLLIWSTGGTLLGAAEMTWNDIEDFLFCSQNTSGMGWGWGRACIGDANHMLNHNAYSRK